MLATPVHLLGLVVRWPVRSQHGARRNALVASTALAERRREQADVEEFLARHAATRGPRAVTIEKALRHA
jgi:hypothetical protein